MQRKIVVNSVYWDVILKCKSNMTNDECFMSIWTEEWGNEPDHYNVINMIEIMRQVIIEVSTEKQCASLLSTLLTNYKTDAAYVCGMLRSYLSSLKVRIGDLDLFIIEANRRYYTIARYDEVFEL